MGRPPCCDNIGVKKGPWTPEEDIMLVSFVQEQGPGNWRTVPTHTGLRRCSKSCRLRWTNYLRPGIKRGSFTDLEEKMIIQLQALLGNKWAAIASYLPERTDNDIKNYWNTHLKKKMKKLETSDHLYSSNGRCLPTLNSTSRGQWERTLQADINTAKQALQNVLSLDKSSPISEYTVTDVIKPINIGCYPPYIKQEREMSTSTYASSAENIAKLLKQWTRSDSTTNSEQSKASSSTQFSCNTNNNAMTEYSSSFELSNSDQFSQAATSEDAGKFHGESSRDVDDEVPLSVMLESWLFDENGDLLI
ncbi:unnamed protein product [Withania somnifera]